MGRDLFPRPERVAGSLADQGRDSEVFEMRRAKLLVMVSDGLPTECSVAALKGVVHQLSRRYAMRCAQVAVREIDEDAKTIAFLDHLQTVLGQPIVLRRLGLEIADRIADEVDELDMADARIVRDLQTLDAVDGIDLREL